MEKKAVKEVTEKEILLQQLELLVERSKEAAGSELHGLTLAITDIIYSISRIAEISNIPTEISNIPVEKTEPFDSEHIEAEQHYISERLNKSIKEQKKWNKIQIICLMGTLINLVLLLIYL